MEGRLKVMGAATYPIDVTLPGMAHAALLQNTVTSGRIRPIAVDAETDRGSIERASVQKCAQTDARGPGHGPKYYLSVPRKRRSSGGRWRNSRRRRRRKATEVCLRGCERMSVKPFT